MGWNRFFRENFVKIGLATIVILQLLVFFWWANNYRSYIPLYDQLYYLKIVNTIYGELANGKFDTLFSYLGGSEIKLLNPNLSFAMTLPFYAVFGASIYSFLALNLVSLVLTSMALYKLGSYINGKRAGMLSTVMFLTFPSVYWFSKFFFTEFMVMPFIVASVYFLIRSEGFGVRKYAILFGIASLLSLMVKNSSWLVLFPSSIFVFFYWKVWKSKTALRNYLISCFGYVLGAAFYLRALLTMYSVSIGFLATLSNSTPINVNGAVFSLSDIVTQIRFLPEMILVHTGPSYFTVFVFSLAILFLNRKKISQEARTCFYVFLISYTILSSYQFLFLSNYSSPAYLNPHIRPSVLSLPFLALTLGFAIFSIKESTLKQFLLAALILSSVVYMAVDFKYNLFYGEMIEDQALRFRTEPEAGRYINFSGEERGFIFNETELNGLFDAVIEDGGGASCVTFSTMVQDSLDFLFLKNGTEGGCDMYFAETMDGRIDSTLVTKIKGARLVLVSDSERQFPGWKSYKDLYDQFETQSGISKGFTLLGSFNVTNWLTVDVYRNDLV